jgi:GT2 family glycosyltransferase
MSILRPRPALSIVIPTHRRPLGLARLLQSLAPQARTQDVIVVNDGTDDATYRAIIEDHREWVHYIANPENRGPGATRNSGVKLATGDFLVFIDDDCVPPSGWLDQLKRLLAGDPQLDAVGGTTRPLPSRQPKWFEQLLTASGCYPNPVFYRDQLIVMVSACLAVRRLVFDAVGGFVERIMPLAEDRNLTTRLRLAGAKCAIEPAWFVYHDMSSTPYEHFRRYFNYGRGVNNAIALEAMPLDRSYWPPTQRSPVFWWARACARLHETAALTQNEHSALARLPIAATAAATNLAMDLGFVYGERAVAARVKESTP